MATNNFNSDPANSAFEPLMSYFDAQGVNRLESANISSYGFDGFIPDIIENRTASGILPGMSISLTGSSTGQNFYKVLSNNIGDREFTENPSGEIVIEYLDDNQIVQDLSASISDIFSVSYENWNAKDIGTTGWYLGNSGNAIFSNVAVRGRIEATSGKVEELLIGSNNYPIINIVGVNIQSSSVVMNKGQFIMNTNVNVKRLYPQDIVQVSGISASGWTYTQGFPTTASILFRDLNKIKVLTASYGDPHKYHCELVQSGVLVDYNLGSMSATSGSFTFGDMFFGDYQTYSLSAPDIIEGFVFDQIGQGGTWDDYIPDFIDISGRFRLAGGRIVFDSNILNMKNITFSEWINSNSSSFSGAINQTGSSLGGVFQTPIYVGVTDGSASAVKGLNINFNNGSFTSREFRIDSAGFSTFSGLFTGTLSASSIKSGALKSVGYNGPPATGSAFSTTGFNLNVNDGSIVSPAIRVTNAGLGYFMGAVTTSNIRINSPDTSNSTYITTESLFTGSTYDTLSLSFYTGSSTFTHNGKSWTVDDIFSNDGTTRISSWLSKPSGADISKSMILNCGTIINNTSGDFSRGPKIELIVSASAISASAAQRVNIISETMQVSGSVFFPQVYNAVITSSRGVEINSSGKLGYITSSFKAKENIIPLLSNDYLNIPDEKLGEEADLEFYYMDVLKLTPVQFDWMDGGKELGFISEQIEEVMPIAAINGDIPSYNPRIIMPALLAVVKKQQEYIEELNSRVLQLESQLGG